MKYKVAIDSSPLTSGHKFRGIGVQVKELIDALKNLKSEFEIVGSDTNKLEVKKYDIVHFTHFHPYFDSIPEINSGVKTVAIVDDLIPLIYPDRYPSGLKGRINLIKNNKKLFKVDAVITISETSKKDIVRFLKIPVEKIFVTHLAANSRFRKLSNDKFLKEVSDKYNLPKKFALYVGDVNYNKNLPTLVKAAEKARVPLVVVGKHAKEIAEGNMIKYRINGPMDYYRFAFNKPHPELAHLSELSGILKNKNVTLTGYVTDEEQVAIYNLATLYCQPSYYEGFGLPVLEAMSSGTPVLASKINVFKEIAGEAAVYANPNSVKEFAGQIDNLFKDKKLRGELSKKGLKKSKEYSWQKTAERTLDVYREIIKQS